MFNFSTKKHIDISKYNCSLITAPLPREFKIAPTDNQSDNQFKIKTFYQSEVLPFRPIKKPNLPVRFWWRSTNLKRIFNFVQNLSPLVFSLFLMRRKHLIVVHYRVLIYDTRLRILYFVKLFII